MNEIKVCSKNFNKPFRSLRGQIVSNSPRFILQFAEVIVEDSDLPDTQGLQSGQSLRRLSDDEVDVGVDVEREIDHRDALSC